MDSENPFKDFLEALNARDDRRSEKRSPYRCVQRVAYLIGERREVGKVEFRDLSASGCGFVSLQLPPGNELIVELGMRPNLTYVRAVVAHIEPIQVDGQPAFLVGCRFIGRADPLMP